MRGDVQLLTIPEDISLGGWSVVERRAGVNPNLRSQIQAEDMGGAVT